jgi:GT2 family glycosyltransferase
MTVDIIICTYNRADTLKTTVQSLLESEFPKDIKVRLVIVNNNSTDSTESVVGEFSRNKSMRIEYLFEKKQGKSHALNTALKHVIGGLVAFTDDDVIVDKGWIRGMVSALNRYPKYNCFGGRVIAVYPVEMPDWLDVNGCMNFLKSAFVDLDLGEAETDYGKGTVSKTPSGVNMFFRREAVERNGFFRTDLGPLGEELGFSEDTEYCRRFLERSERFMYVPSAIIYHPVHTGRMNQGYVLRWQYRCGRSEVRRSGGYEDKAKFFGAPRYLFRKFMQHAAGWLLSPQSRKRFYHKLKLYYTYGEIEEHLRIGAKKT